MFLRIIRDYIVSYYEMGLCQLHLKCHFSLYHEMDIILYISYYIVVYNIISYYIILCYIVLYHITLYCMHYFPLSSDCPSGRDISTFLDNFMAQTTKTIYFTNADHPYNLDHLDHPNQPEHVDHLEHFYHLDHLVSQVQPSTHQYSPAQPSRAK